MKAPSLQDGNKRGWVFPVIGFQYSLGLVRLCVVMFSLFLLIWS